MSSVVAPVEDRRSLGIGLLLLAQLAFVFLEPSAKWLGMQGMSAPQIAFVRYAVQTVLILAIVWPRAGLDLMRTRAPGMEVTKAILLLGSSVLNFIAVRYLPLPVNTSINFIMPLMVCALSVPLLGERVSGRHWIAIIIGFIGVVVIIRPGTEAFQPAALIPISTATITAFYMILNRKLAGVDSASTQQFYSGAIGLIVIAPFALQSWIWPADAAGWFFFFAVGVSGWIGHLLLTVAARYAPASVLAPFNYFGLVYISITSWLMFNQPPDASIYLGAPVVIASGLYIWYLGRSERPAARRATT
jgi:drug/metabolite transporter (DMT)-like permease